MQASFGQSCTETKQCSVGLICGLNGAVQNICLKDFDQRCGSNNECVNQVGCFNGVCGCSVKLYFYNIFKHSIIAFFERYRDRPKNDETISMLFGEEFITATALNRKILLLDLRPWLLENFGNSDEFFRNFPISNNRFFNKYRLFNNLVETIIYIFTSKTSLVKVSVIKEEFAIWGFILLTC